MTKLQFNKLLFVKTTCKNSQIVAELFVWNELMNWIKNMRWHIANCTHRFDTPVSWTSMTLMLAKPSSQSQCSHCKVRALITASQNILYEKHKRINIVICSWVVHLCMRTVSKVVSSGTKWSVLEVWVRELCVREVGGRNTRFAKKWAYQIVQIKVRKMSSTQWKIVENLFTVSLWDLYW